MKTNSFIEIRSPNECAELWIHRGFSPLVNIFLININIHITFCTYLHTCSTKQISARLQRNHQKTDGAECWQNFFSSLLQLTREKVLVHDINKTSLVVFHHDVLSQARRPLAVHRALLIHLGTPTRNTERPTDELYSNLFIDFSSNLRYESQI